MTPHVYGNTHGSAWPIPVVRLKHCMPQASCLAWAACVLSIYRIFQPRRTASNIASANGSSRYVACRGYDCGRCRHAPGHRLMRFADFQMLPPTTSDGAPGSGPCQGCCQKVRHGALSRHAPNRKLKLQLMYQDIRMTCMDMTTEKKHPPWGSNPRPQG